jgi:hypothetical protein
MIRENTDFPNGSQVLSGTSIRDLIPDLLEFLKPPGDRPVLPPTNGAPRVYLLFDPTTRQDGEFAATLEALISERHMTVFKPDLSLATRADRLQRHELFLRECDGILLYRDGAPTEWLAQTLPDVLLAEFKLHRPPLSAKTCVVTDPQPLQGLRDLEVIRRDEPFDPAHLGRFFSQMQKASRVHAGN